MPDLQLKIVQVQPIIFVDGYWEVEVAVQKPRGFPYNERTMIQEWCDKHDFKIYGIEQSMFNYTKHVVFASEEEALAFSMMWPHAK